MRGISSSTLRALCRSLAPDNAFKTRLHVEILGTTPNLDWQCWNSFAAIRRRWFLINASKSALNDRTVGRHLYDGMERNVRRESTGRDARPNSWITGTNNFSVATKPDWRRRERTGGRRWKEREEARRWIKAAYTG